MNNEKLPVYVTDTNALFWYLSDASRLSAAADAVFRLAAAGHAHIMVPAMVLAEILTLTQKAGHPMPAASLRTSTKAPNSSSLRWVRSS